MGQPRFAEEAFAKVGLVCWGVPCSDLQRRLQAWGVSEPRHWAHCNSQAQPTTKCVLHSAPPPEHGAGGALEQSGAAQGRHRLAAGAGLGAGPGGGRGAHPRWVAEACCINKPVEGTGALSCMPRAMLGLLVRGCTACLHAYMRRPNATLHTAQRLPSGTRRIKYLQENLGAAAVQLSAEELDELNTIFSHENVGAEGVAALLHIGRQQSTVCEGGTLHESMLGSNRHSWRHSVAAISTTHLSKAAGGWGALRRAHDEAGVAHVAVLGCLLWPRVLLALAQDGHGMWPVRMKSQWA